MSIGLEIGLRELTLPAVYRRFEQEIVVKEADREQRESILREIESGDIFETDRIALDPYFGKEMAGKRYANWSRIFSSRTDMYVLDIIKIRQLLLE